MKFATRNYRAPYGFEQVEMKQEGKELDAVGLLYVALTEYKKQDPVTPSPLSVGTPGDKRSGPVEDRFSKILERRRAESDEESMDETLSETGEEMEVGNTPEPKSAEGLRTLGTLDEKAWREFLSEFNQETNSETTLDNFKEELWNTVVKFGEPVLMGTGLDEKARKELLSEMVKLRETRQKTEDDECKDGSTLKQKTDNKMVKSKGEDKFRTNNMIKSTKILKARAGGGKSWKGRTMTKRSNQ